MKPPIKAPVEKSPELVRRIGTIAVKWAMLDTILAKLMGEAIRDDDIGSAIYFSTSSQNLRFAQLRAVIDVRIWPGVGVKADLLKAVSKLDDLWGARNDIMHNHAVAHYVRGKDKPVYVLHIHRPVRKVKKEERPLNKIELDQHIQAVSTIAGELWDFVWRDQIKQLDDWKRQGRAQRRASRRKST